MKSFIEYLEENCIKYSKETAIISQARKKGISYSQLWEFSGKVYAWLKQAHIGKEDMVLINLPRGIRIITTMVGVIRSGAAFTIVEYRYPKERVEYIKNDCKCKLVINAELYEQMMLSDSYGGYEKTDPHDAAFAVYTSGSTGNPKGVLHEFGKLSQIAEHASKYVVADLPAQSKAAWIAPFNFVGAILFAAEALMGGFCLYIVQYDTVKDISKLSSYLIDNRVAFSFFPPSLLRVYNKISPYLKKILVGSEPCNGIYNENIKILNAYASSEFGLEIATFDIDKPYDITPAGTNKLGINPFIIDEDGNKVPNGETGEVCIFNEFTRGYINLPEKTAEVFRNKIYHTGDIGFINEDGLLVVLGRKDDMIKINGNRVEPAEIEFGIRQVFGVNNVLAKGFNQDNRSFICVYFLRKEVETLGLIDGDGKLTFTPAEAAARLSDKLPYYMIPLHYIVLEEFPKNQNGKVVRGELAAPEMGRINDEYEMPEDKIEEYFCSLYEKVLNVERVGRNDDFYSLGGDSLSSIELISQCNIEGMTVSEIFNLRTPHRLKEFYYDNLKSDSMPLKEKNEKAMKHNQMLLPEMETVLGVQEIIPDSTMWNLPILLKLKKGVDPEKLAKAIDMVIEHHPVYSTEIVYDDYSSLKQRYNPEILNKTVITDISDRDFAELKKTLVKPFSPEHAPYYRSFIYRTSDAAYLFMDHYHLISDGTSLNILFHQISECYKDPSFEIPADYYYLMVREEEKKKREDESSKIVNYYRDFWKTYFVDNDTDIMVKPENSGGTLSRSEIYTNTLSISKNRLKEAVCGLSENEFFLVTCLLSIAKYNNKQSSYFQWTYNGRDSVEKNQMTGLLFKSLPIASLWSDKETIDHLFNDVKEQVRFTVANNSIKLNSVAGAKVDYCLFFLFQKNVFSKDSFDLAEELIPVNSGENVPESLIEMKVIDNDAADKYYYSIEFDVSWYNMKFAETFFDFFDRIALRLADIKDPQNICIKDFLDRI